MFNCHEEKYDYCEAIKQDIRDYIEEHIELSDFASRQDLEETLEEDLWTADSVTGNASGSYTCNTWRAEEYLCHNLDLLREACEEFCTDMSIMDSAEACDCTIRCYLLSGCLSEVLDEIEQYYDFAELYSEE